MIRRRLVTALVLFSPIALSAQQQTSTFVGVITDTMCRARHGKRDLYSLGPQASGKVCWSECCRYGRLECGNQND